MKANYKNYHKDKIRFTSILNFTTEINFTRFHEAYSRSTFLFYTMEILKDLLRLNFCFVENKNYIGLMKIAVK